MTRFFNYEFSSCWCQYNTGLFISASGISELDCATTKTDTAERSISTERERERDTPSFCSTLQVLDMCTLGDAGDVTIDLFLANSKTQNAFLFTMKAIFRHDYPLAVEPTSTPRPLVQKKIGRDSLPIDMLLSAVSVLVVVQSSSEIPEGLMNNPVHGFQILTLRKRLLKRAGPTTSALRPGLSSELQ